MVWSRGLAAVRRVPVLLVVTLLLSVGVFLFDLLDSFVQHPAFTPLPAAPYAAAVLIAAYFLSLRALVLVLFVAALGQLVVAWDHQASAWLTAMELLDLLLMGFLGMVLSVKNVREANLRREAQAGLARLEAVVQHMVEGVLIADADTGRLTANPPIVRMFGEPAPGETFLETSQKAAERIDMCSPDGRAISPADRPMQRVLRGETVTDLEVLVSRRDLDRTWLATFSGQPVRDLSGRIVQGVLTVRDVTAQRQAEEVLRESEERFRLIVTNSRDTVFHQDRDLRYTWVVNPPPPFTGDDLLGKTDCDLFKGGEGAWLMRVKGRVLETGAGLRTTLALHAGGEERFTYWDVEPRRDREGQVVGLAGYVRDMTESKRDQDELLEQRCALAIVEERERLARELHDNIGQVLGYINTEGQAARMLLTRGDTATADEYLSRMVMVARETHTDVRDFILGVRTAASAEREFFRALDQHVRGFGRFHGIATELVVPPELPERGFPPIVEVQLLRILQEALTNVRKHACARRVRIVFEELGDRVQVVVEDDGRGFDPKKLQPCGDQTLGTCVMGERAREVGGTVEIRSAPGQGTRVIVHVPMGRKPGKEADETPAR